MRSHFALSLVAAALLPTAGQADIVTFTSRPAWDATAGPSGFVEGFQGFTADVQFRTQLVNVGPFTLQQQGTTGVLRNFIDAPPFNPMFPEHDGTTHASLFTDFGSTTVAMTFTGLPLSAWGADFFGASTGEGVSLDLLDPDGKLLASLAVPVDTDFFGFVSDGGEAVQRIVFRSSMNEPGALGEGFGLDNVAGVVGVPEPGGLALAGLAVACVGGYAGRRWVRR